MSLPHLLYTMARRGLLNPGRPDRVARQLHALARWGLSLAGEFRSGALRDPDRVAIVDDAGSYTFSEVEDRADRLARGLRATLREPDRVGVLCRNHAGMVEVMLACAKLGADIVLLNTGLSADQLGRVLAEQDVGLIVADPEFEGLLAGTDPPKIWTGHMVDEVVASAPGDALDPPARNGRTIILTSGTTGAPKGARRPHPGGLQPLASVLSRIPLYVGDRTLISAPLFHTWGYAGLQLALATRATIVLQRKFDGASAAGALAEHRCTAMWAVPVMLQRMLEAPRVPTPDLRVVAVSGSALHGGLATAFMDAFGDVLYNLYGSTEVSWVTIATPADLRAAADTAGRPPYGTKVAILDAAGEPVPTGATGRIFAGNDMLFEGYTNGAGKQRIGGLMSTGDMGHVDAAGRLFVDGREDDMIISGGENVYPRELEDLLNALPEVREACVYGVDDAEFGQRLACWVVLRDGSTLTGEEIRALVRHRLARFNVPRDVHFLDVLPRNATGKVVPRLLPR